MREVEQLILDLFESGEEVHIPDIVDKIIENKKQEMVIKERATEIANNRHVMNYVRSVLRRLGVRVRSTKKLTLKKLTTESDYQLLRQKKINQRYRLDQEIENLEKEMLSLGYSYQPELDFEGGKRRGEATKNIAIRSIVQSSKESKKAVND